MNHQAVGGVVISNCVINLSVVKPNVLSEMFCVLAPGGTTRQATTPTMSTPDRDQIRRRLENLIAELLP